MGGEGLTLVAASLVVGNKQGRGLRPKGGVEWGEGREREDTGVEGKGLKGELNGERDRKEQGREWRAGPKRGVEWGEG